MIKLLDEEFMEHLRIADDKHIVPTLLDAVNLAVLLAPVSQLQEAGIVRIDQGSQISPTQIRRWASDASTFPVLSVIPAHTAFLMRKRI